jgi:hypothetical protein
MPRSKKKPLSDAQQSLLNLFCNGITDLQVPKLQPVTVPVAKVPNSDEPIGVTPSGLYEVFEADDAGAEYYGKPRRKK